MELVNIETSTNIFGFDFLTKPKIEEFIKYYSIGISPEPGYDLDDEKNNNPICEVEFTLNDKILYERRQYIQFIDMLGEVGGLMEFLFSFFGLICNVIGDLLYKKTMANNLFSFDIKNKLILIKKRNNSIHNISNNKDKDKEKYKSNDINYSPYIPNNKKIVSNKLILNNNNIEEINSKFSLNNLIKTKFITEIQTYRNDIKILKNNKKFHNNDFENLNKEKKRSGFLGSKRNNFFINNHKKDLLIDIISLEDLFASICFCYPRKIKNIYKMLLKETMEIVTEKFDILNIFRDLCLIGDMRKYSNHNIENIKMSDKCSNYFLEMK